MKALTFLKIVTVLTLSTLAFTQAALASEGGNGSGGGNVEPSTKADLVEIVRNFSETAWEISDSYLRGGTFEITQSPLNGSLLAVTRSVLGSSKFQISEAAEAELAHLKIEIVEGPCIDGGEEKDASTSYQIGSPVCLSASRLSRFPRVELKSALIPLIFHELAHQHGFGEAEAKQFQQLVSLHLKYRPIFLASMRSQVGCGYVTEKPLSANEKAVLHKSVPPGSSWPAKQPKGRDREQALMFCASNAREAADSLELLYNGSWSEPEPTTLSQAQQTVLKIYSQGGGMPTGDFTFRHVIKSLKEPGLSGYSGCRSVCRPGGVDPAYIMMLGAQAAVSHIDREVGRLQNLIR